MLALKEIRSARRKTQAEVASYLQISRSTYTNIEIGRRDPDTWTILALADYFCVTLDELFGRSNSPKPLSAEEQELIRDFQKLSKTGREYIRTQMDIALAVYSDNTAVKKSSVSETA